MLLLWRSWLREVGGGAYTGRPSISACVSALDLAAASAAFFAAFSSSIFFSNSLAFSAAFVAFLRWHLQFAVRQKTLKRHLLCCRPETVTLRSVFGVSARGRD